MPVPNAAARARYPVMAYNFRVTLGSGVASFAEVSGLQREFETVTYRHGFSYREGEDITKYTIAKYTSLTLRRGVFRGAKSLYSWLEEKSERPITITLCDDLGKGVVAWNIARALVVKIDAPGLDAKSNDVAIDTLELKVAATTINELPADDEGVVSTILGLDDGLRSLI